jgi:hypothetical protein
MYLQSNDGSGGHVSAVGSKMSLPVDDCRWCTKMEVIESSPDSVGFHSVGDSIVAEEVKEDEDEDEDCSRKWDSSAACVIKDSGNDGTDALAPASTLVGI